VFYTVEVDVYEVNVRSEVDLVDFLSANYEVSSFGQTVSITLFTIKYARYETVVANFLCCFLANYLASRTID
jgi:hypothetical protein